MRLTPGNVAALGLGLILMAVPSTGYLSPDAAWGVIAIGLLLIAASFVSIARPWLPRVGAGPAWEAWRARRHERQNAPAPLTARESEVLEALARPPAATDGDDPNEVSARDAGWVGSLVWIGGRHVALVMPASTDEERAEGAAAVRQVVREARTVADLRARLEQALGRRFRVEVRQSEIPGTGPVIVTLLRRPGAT